MENSAACSRIMSIIPDEEDLKAVRSEPALIWHPLSDGDDIVIPKLTSNLQRMTTHVFRTSWPLNGTFVIILRICLLKSKF